MPKTEVVPNLYSCDTGILCPTSLIALRRHAQAVRELVDCVALRVYDSRRSHQRERQSAPLPVIFNRHRTLPRIIVLYEHV